MAVERSDHRTTGSHVNVRLANGPVSWGVDYASDPTNPSWRVVLDGIAEAGYTWVELGPVGYLPEDSVVLGAELASRSLEVAGTFVFEPLHDPARFDETLAVTQRTCQLLAAVGGRHLVIIDLLSPDRMRTAGRSEAARRLDRDAQSALARAVRAVAALARDEYGLIPVVHPHVGTYIEFGDEIEALLAELDPGLVQLCIDTGHSAYAGVDPVALYERHAERVPYLHLKDVEAVAHRRAVEEPLDFEAAVAAGAFCPLGTGVVDFAALRDRLERAGFDGFATVEQDRDPQGRDNPLADAIESRSFLRDVGIANERKGAAAALSDEGSRA
jgi:inosose dehydratase